MLTLPFLIPADKAQHYAYGNLAAIAGAELGMAFGASLAHAGGIAAASWLMLACAAFFAPLLAWVAGQWKEARDRKANGRAYERYRTALDAAQAAGGGLPEFVPTHEVSSADVRATLAGALPVLATLGVVALNTLIL